MSCFSCPFVRIRPHWVNNMSKLYTLSTSTCSCLYGIKVFRQTTTPSYLLSLRRNVCWDVTTSTPFFLGTFVTKYFFYRSLYWDGGRSMFRERLSTKSFLSGVSFHKFLYVLFIVDILLFYPLLQVSFRVFQYLNLLYFFFNYLYF